MHLCIIVFDMTIKTKKKISVVWVWHTRRAASKSYSSLAHQQNMSSRNTVCPDSDTLLTDVNTVQMFPTKMHIKLLTVKQTYQKLTKASAYEEMTSLHFRNNIFYISYIYTHPHRVPKKGATKLMVVISSNLNWFNKIFWKRKKFAKKFIYYFPPHLNIVAALPLEN